MNTKLGNITKVAADHRLRTAVDRGDNTTIVPGKHGHLCEYDDNRLAVVYLSQSVGKANLRRKSCEKAGMEITQNGDTEFVAVFDPKSPKQTALAMQVAGSKKRRILSESQLGQLKAARALSPLSKGSGSPVEEAVLMA